MAGLFQTILGALGNAGSAMSATQANNFTKAVDTSGYNRVSYTPGTSAAQTGAALANEQSAKAAADANAVQAGFMKMQMDYQTQSAEKAMMFNALEAEKNRQWQEKMSNTQYQRAMADMKKAGLNPILAYSQGGAGTPAGASAQGIAMSGAGGSAHQAQVFKGNQIEDIFNTVAMTGLTAMSIINKIKYPFR